MFIFKRKPRRKICQGVGETLNLLFTCLLFVEFCLDVMLCSNLGNENSYGGYIKCSCWLHVLHL